MYKKERNENNQPVASPSIYRKIFSEEYNIGFYRPRKDQCRTCMSYNSPANDKRILETEYQARITAKNRARCEKVSNKQLAENSDGKISCSNFDLQQVLLVANDPTNNALFYN